MSSRKHPRGAALAAAAVLVLVPVAAGCGNGDGGEPQTSPSPAATATQGQNQPSDPAAARAEVEKNWTAFFAPATPAEEKVRLLENGERMQPVLQALSGSPQAAQTSVKVENVTFTSPTQGEVTYDLLVAGSPALPDSKGTTVLQDDTWKVSVKTLCALVKLSPDASPVPGC
ncbi:hypothetical protein [Streptomyces ficellus]|uniref:Low molecular weight antigen MTB12-like C-terminal domain-containing protein n=1 Tax=Streptomyces ficellus TaxID=1977088 RepID=A0A6I6FBI8_9ACTN|nr:hypothetical protein [Streptomyces ficellus]QGV81373.1 hypothetical protein EIZ62_26360 [Streptomyces ficellus]